MTTQETRAKIFFVMSIVPVDGRALTVAQTSAITVGT